MFQSPIRRLSALSAAVVIGTLGLGVPGAIAAPAPAAPAPAPAAPAPAAPPSAPETSERVDVVVLLKEQPSSPSTAAETSRLATQKALISQWAGTFDLQVDRQFGYLANGFSASMPADKMAALGLEPEVASVRIERVYQPTEHSARDLEGVPSAFAEYDVDGEGMVISIIDSGLDPAHPAMRLDDCDAAAIQDINPAAEAGFTCKIPNGYNYADENYIIKDATVQAHGQHVGGIAAANASEGDQPDAPETGHIDGVAPNAQLLAMKVFSNAGGGASDSDIVAAIEDSVKLGADVLNLSLGSPNGTKNTSAASTIAIDAARDAGVISVIAAGNDGQNFSVTGIDDDALGLHDDGTVGAPGTHGSALTVASVDNATLTMPVAYLNGDQSLPYVLASGTPDDQEHTLVDLGLATVEETAGLDLGGDYALIERGEIAFAEKYHNAIGAGAGGVVVFNNADGGEATFGMAGIEEFTIPGIVVQRSSGLTLREAIATGPAQLRITEDVEVSANPSALTVSDFTSWGATPALDFEPEIAGIGGNVYSTYNDGTYGMSSGTSMASPNVAGLSALVLEHLAETRPEVTGADRVELAKVLLMNTALIPEDENGVPASPRQIGAGLAQVDRALNTSVTATVNGQGAAELRQLDGPASFTITLTNSSEQDHSFTVPSGQSVLAESNEAGAATTVRVSDGTLTSSVSDITVAAGSEATLDVTVTPEAGPDHFLGGWVALESTDSAQPSLTVPYLGFAGDWNAEPIILPEEDALPVTAEGLGSELLGTAGASTVPLSGGDDAFWLSPNDDGNLDVVAPSLVVMRNASDIRYEVLTADGQSVRSVGQEENIYRQILSAFVEAPDPSALRWQGAAFDGTVYDPQSAQFETVADGEYVYRVSTRLSEDFPWQETDFAFGVDATAPEIEFGALEAGLLTFTVTEDGSGLVEAPTLTGAGGEAIEVTESTDGDGNLTYAAQIGPDLPFVTVTAVDGGMNVASATRVFVESTVVIDNGTQLAAGAIGPQSPGVEDGVLALRGHVSDDITALTVNGQDAPLEDGTFEAAVELVEGPQSIVIEASDASGTLVSATTYEVVYDLVAPVLTITDMATDEHGDAVLDANGTITVRGTVTDDREDAELTVSSGETTVPVAADGSFEITVTPGDVIGFVLAASDGANSTAEVVYISGRVAPPSPVLLELSNAECSFADGYCLLSADNPDYDQDGSVFSLRGTYAGGGTMTISQGGRFGEDGTVPAPQPISVDLGEDGDFTVDLPVVTGENGYRIVLTDAAGHVVYDAGFVIYADTTAPTLQIDQPTLIGGTLYTATSDVTVAGSAADDGFGYTFSLNGDVIVELADLGSPGEASTTRDFSAQVQVAGGDTLLVRHSDALGNTVLGLIPVVLDDVSPNVTVDGTADEDQLGQVARGTELPVVAEDDNLASLTVTVDGTLVDQQVTTLSTQEHPLEDALIDLSTLQAQTEGEITTTGVRTTAIEDRLESVVATGELEPGEHVIGVISTDLAGNTTERSVVFELVSILELDGPETVDLEVYREALADQDTLAQQVLDRFEATADGDAAAAAGTTLTLAPGTALVEGEQQVTVLATDDSGRSAEATVIVTITLRSVTLTDGDVTATSTFRSDDALSATVTTDGEEQVLTISNGKDYAALDAVITAPGVEGSTVVRMLEDGRRIPVAATWADGTFTFAGPSKATYRIIPPTAGGGDEDGGEPGDNGTGPGTGGGSDGSGGPDDSSGSSNGQDGEGSPGPLARTGFEAYAFVIVAGGLIALGGALVVRRRR